VLLLIWLLVRWIRVRQDRLLLAIGVVAEFALGTGEVIAALLGIAVVAALWWAYFDIVAIVAERRLIEAPSGVQAPMARDAYSYLHFPLIAGIVLLALIPLALTADALVSLAAVAVVLAILIGYEAVRFRDRRARVRANPSATLAEMRET